MKALFKQFSFPDGISSHVTPTTPGSIHEGGEPALMHARMAEVLDTAVAEIRTKQQAARNGGAASRPAWPMIVVKSQKGCTGLKIVDGLKIEGTLRSHQVPLLVDSAHPAHVPPLESWMKSYQPDELFDADGCRRPELAALAPVGLRRMGSNPRANGGLVFRDLAMPDFRNQAVSAPGVLNGQDMIVLGRFLRDVAMSNMAHGNFRILGPDETLSNLLGAVFEATNRQWDAITVPGDALLARGGCVQHAMLRVRTL